MMINLTILSREDLEYICGQLHMPSVRKLFQRTPKQYNKMTSIRPVKLSDEQIIQLLVRNINRDFIHSLLYSQIDQWLTQIEDSRAELVNSGYSANEALINTLSESVFCSRVDLFFKLTDDQYSEDDIDIFIDAVALLQKCRAELKNDDSKNQKVQTEFLTQIEKLKRHNESLEQLCADRESEINRLRDTIDRQKGQISETEALLLELENQNQSDANLIIERDEEISVLQSQIRGLNSENEMYRKSQIESQEHLSDAHLMISELQHELDHYRYLASFEDKKPDRIQDDSYDYISVGQIIEIDFRKIRIKRIADIIDGEIIEFVQDENQPKLFGNRDRLYWNDGPNTSNAVGVWRWSATQKYSDPTKDHVETKFAKDIQLIQVITLLECHTVDDIIAELKSGFVCNISFEKLLFVGGYIDGASEGVLCRKKDLIIDDNIIKLRESVFTLPKYSLNSSNILILNDVDIYRKVWIGIPEKICYVRTPFELIKEKLLRRARNSVLQEQELTRRESQGCRDFLRSLPVETLAQEISDVYSCSLEEAEKYINDFVSYSDSILTKSDVDIDLISAAIQRNPELVAVCKEALRLDWERDNNERLRIANEELEKKKTLCSEEEQQVLELRTECTSLEIKSNALQDEIDSKRQLATEVEQEVQQRIEKAKQNAASFIAQMSFIPSIPVSHFSTHVNANSNRISVLTHRKLEDSVTDEITELDCFVDELDDNFFAVGYDEDYSPYMAEAVAFAIAMNLSIIIDENAYIIAECIAAMFGTDRLTEINVPIGEFDMTALISVIRSDCNNNVHVFLINGVFDGFNQNTYNCLLSHIKDFDKKAIIVLSIEGIQPEMLMSSTWNHALYFDGDAHFGYRECVELSYHQTELSIIQSIKETLSVTGVSEKRKLLKPFKKILTNVEIINFSCYLAYKNIMLNSSAFILKQIQIIARINCKNCEGSGY